MVAVRSMVLGVPVPNASLYLAQKVEAALLGQVSEIADQICNGVLMSSAAVLLKNFNCLGSPVDVIGFFYHDFVRLLGL